MLTDIFKRPVKVGDTVLTTGYYSAVLNEIAEVKKITKDHIHVDIAISSYNYQTGHRDISHKRMKRDRYQFVIINEQLQFNHDNFPEYYI